VAFVPRSEMAAQYRWADIFLLPSLSEGSANVCFEALAAGLPVITTPNAGSVVRDGIEGFVVPIRSVDRIVAAIHKLTTDANLCEAMGRAAFTCAKHFSWAKYEEELVDAIRSIF